MKPRITVVGSTNTDMIIKVPHLPSPGETVLGGEFSIVQGGKGANQAVAAARAGGQVTFITCLGNDTLGIKSLEGLSAEGIDTTAIKVIEGHSSGVALINVSINGENSISVAPGANSHLLPGDIERKEKIIRNADILLLQLEIPLDTVRCVIQIASIYKVPVILNPAPAIKLELDLLRAIDILTPNEKEAATVIGLKEPETEYVKLGAALLKIGSKKVVITLGEKGVYYVYKGTEQYVPAHKVEAVDTTAAGDTFNGYLAMALARGDEMECAVKMANYAASLSVTSFGAQSSIPYLHEVEALVNTDL